MAWPGSGSVKGSVGLVDNCITYATRRSSLDLGAGTSVQPSRLNSAVAGQTICPLTVVPTLAEPPLGGRSPLAPHAGDKIGSRNAVTVSTATSTKVCGW